MNEITILYCPQHDFYAVAINDLRITPSKCCGSWDVHYKWMGVTDERIHASLGEKIVEDMKKKIDKLKIELTGWVGHDIGLMLKENFADKQVTFDEAFLMSLRDKILEEISTYADLKKSLTEETKGKL